MNNKYKELLQNSPCPRYPSPQSDKETLMQGTYILLAVLLVDISFAIINKHLLNDIHSFEVTTKSYIENGICIQIITCW